MTFPEVPDFTTLFVAAVVAISCISMLTLITMAYKSRAVFGGDVLAALGTGRLPQRSFYIVLMLQFVVAAGFLISLNEERFVDHDLGLGAYLGSGTTRFDARLDLTQYCGWQDVYPYGRMGEILFGADIPLRRPNVAVPEADPRMVEFNALISGLEAQFRREAPGAIRDLTERLNPIFAILSAFFLVVARGVFQSDAGKGHPMSGAISGGVLAFAFIMLGYFVILGYHSSTEVSAAFVSGRVLCIAHVAPFFVAQTQALVAATVGLLVLFVLSPGTILKKI